MIANPATYLDSIRTLLTKPWPTNRTVNIVTHGHSVPSGYFSTPTVDTFNAYPHLLHMGIKSHYPHAVVNVIVTAIGGENAVVGAARFESDVLCHRPDVITLDYGLNDRSIGLEAAEPSWRSIIESALAADCKVILLTPTVDTREDLDDPNNGLQQHAAQIRRLADEYNVGLVDSLEAFMNYKRAGHDISDLMSHVNHPNRAGHDLVAAALLPWFATQDDQ